MTYQCHPVQYINFPGLVIVFFVLRSLLVPFRVVTAFADDVVFLYPLLTSFLLMLSNVSALRFSFLP